MPQRLVPAIDIGPFEHGSAEEKRAIAEQVDEACRSIGFLVITGHGVPRQDIDDALAAGRAFFDLPDAEKRRSISPGGLAFQGYKALLTSNLAATLGRNARRIFARSSPWRPATVSPPISLAFRAPPTFMRRTGGPNVPAASR